MHLSQTTPASDREEVATISLTISPPEKAAQQTKETRDLFLEGKRDVGADEGHSKSLISMQGFSEWEHGKFPEEGELRTLLVSQWAYREGEPIPLNCMLLDQSSVS